MSKPASKEDYYAPPSHPPPPPHYNSHAPQQGYGGYSQGPPAAYSGGYSQGPQPSYGGGYGGGGYGGAGYGGAGYGPPPQQYYPQMAQQPIYIQQQPAQDRQMDSCAACLSCTFAIVNIALCAELLTMLII